MMQGWTFGPLTLAETSQDESPWLFLGILVVLLGIAVWFNMWARKRYRDQRTLREQGQLTQGTIVADGFSISGPGVSSRQLSYEYRVPDPAMPQHTKRYTGHIAARYFPRSMRKGESFELRYLPENPKVHEGQSFPYTRGMVGWLIFVNVYALGALALLGLWLFG